VDAAAEKAKALGDRRRAYFAHLDARIPELHKSGFPGRLARHEADREWANR
jgi:hypothetical protein